ncbi:MAG: hypothetical protein ACE3JN_11325 [Ectobacillus sp.]
MLIGNKRRRLQREKRLGPARGKCPPVVENQQPSLTEPFKKAELLRSALRKPIRLLLVYGIYG